VDTGINHRDIEPPMMIQQGLDGGDATALLEGGLLKRVL
jgi:hypothetical protein